MSTPRDNRFYRTASDDVLALAETPAEDDMARRIADCLGAHLADYGFDPYRYPSGENKGVQVLQPGVVSLFAADGSQWEVTVAATGDPA